MTDSKWGETTRTVGIDPRPDDSAPCLVMIRGPQLGLRISLRTGESSLGRSPQCDVAVALNGVSRLHCAFQIEGGNATLRDLGSKNGTWLNGERLEPHRHQPLLNGAVIHAGEASFKFIAHGDAEAAYHEAVYKMLTEDALTGAKNRRFLMDVLEREVAREHREESGLALLLVDVDEFKRTNDACGHVFGDYVLREVAALIARDTRRTDCLARYGGDEFAVVLTDTTRNGAEIFAERLRGSVELTRFALDLVSRSITISIGVAHWAREIGTPAAFLAAADTALYAAKAAGRNRVAS